MSFIKNNNALEIKNEDWHFYYNYTIENKIDSISINTANGYQKKNIEPYCSWEHILKLKVYLTVLDFDFSCINKMKWLEELFLHPIYIENYKFNFDTLINLKSINIDWNKNLIGLDKLKNLNTLHYAKYKGGNNLFVNYPDLEDLGLTQGNHKDLEMLKSFKKLKKLYLAYIPSIKDSFGLKYIYDTVEEIDIEACNNLVIEEHLPHFKKLKLLRLESKNDLKDLKWVEKLPNLEFLALGNTNVVDGDFTPVKDIKYVSMSSKKHYNYRFDISSMKIVPKA